MNTPDTVPAAQTLIARGWPVMLTKPNSKEPLTRHGVKDATTTERIILQLLDRHPDANLAVATGAPGPSVLDVDEPDRAGDVLDAVRRVQPPEVAAVRGPHYYFRGTEQGTISLGFGELRGRGSYILVPPSIHPTGKQYTWLQAPDGPLPPLPDALMAIRQPAGTGTFDAPELISYGQRHDALKDAAIRFLRAGIIDAPTLELMLESFFTARCDPQPPPRRNEFRDLAKWAASSHMADREREREPDPEPEPETTKTKKGKKKTVLEKPPSGGAPLAEHRAYLRAAGGWSDGVDVKDVKQYGIRAVDALEIHLTNGLQIVFDRQDHVTTRGHWARTVTVCTGGIADPMGLSDWEAQKVFRSLCILADTPPTRREAEELEEAISDLLAIAEPVTGHDLSTPGGRYDATSECRARKVWNPRERDPDHRPAVIIDADGTRYLRAGELRDYLAFHNLGISTSALPGRMQMIGARRITIDGREAERLDGKQRRTNRMQLYQLPPAS